LREDAEDTHVISVEWSLLVCREHDDVATVDWTAGAARDA
jgi:hypothetical protein